MSLAHRAFEASMKILILRGFPSWPAKGEGSAQAWVTTECNASANDIVSEGVTSRCADVS
jgi:hypothetical protein